ncbi:hypothetical protein CQY20_00550 [Mycolicibacterium agri]|uniref:Uncharacterized protein n=1 Tax=Mycolicibacterium agri TaxID=36811 RepID=A0A2A7NH66_MYCAG|nr:hypothetical protein [Mycolicibacterium agri]PEG43113.1 hypothetical protein CQY20_00550 [Mycolicibacterium agri]GFG54494.1 hypothetical protein MAGR_59350 [Mycolicibacterium agri]
MKKFGFATVIASGLAAAVFGFAAPAQAVAPAAPSDVTIAKGVDHLDWLNDIQQRANAPRVDNSVRSHP